jgi:hypothetical protein
MPHIIFVDTEFIWVVKMFDELTVAKSDSVKIFFWFLKIIILKSDFNKFC